MQKELSQFGYDFFTATPTTFVPVTNLPIPFDYRVGPGDNVVIQLYGKKNVEYRLVVHRDGRLLIPDFGPFEVNGMTFQELKATLQELLEKGLIGTKVVVTMADIRTIQIVVAGEVKQPGRYTISGLSTLFNALLNSGGVKRTGSLRNIQLKRLGVTVATFDLYDVLLRGDSSSDVRLQQNDILFVPSIGSTVGIGGEIQRPAIYELKGEQTLGEIITMAGNLLPTASLEESHIERISSNGYRTIVELDDSRGETSAMLETPVIQGDIIRVLSVTDTMRDIVVLSGHVARPGGYQFTPGKRIRDVITGVDNLLPNADLNFSLLRREIPSTRKIEVKYVDLGKMLADPESDANIVLQSRDELFVFERARARTRPIENIVEQLKHQAEEYELPMTVQVRGNTRHTGEFPLQENSRLEKVISLAGGMLPGSDRDYVLVTRTNPITRQLSMFSIKYDPTSSSRIEARNPVILPADRIYVFDRNSDRSELIREDLDRLVEQTRYGELSPVVFVDGPVRIPGRYPYELGMELADLIRAAGGLKEKAYGHVAELTRFEFLDDEYQQVYHEQLDLEQILVSESHYEVYPYDHLTLMPKPNLSDTSKVTVTGEVRFPGTYIIKPGESLCSLVQRIGGFKPSAYLYGSIYTRESVRQRQQAAFDRLQDQLDDLLVQLHVSPSALNMEKMPSREDNHEMIQVEFPHLGIFLC